MLRYLQLVVLSTLLSFVFSDVSAQFDNAYHHLLSDEHTALEKSVSGTCYVQASTTLGVTRDIHLMKFDAQGNVLLDELFFSPGGDEVALDICRGNNNTFIICGYEHVNGLDIGFVMAVDTNFVLLNKVYIEVPANDRHTPALNVINSAFYDQPTYGQYFIGDTSGGYLVTGFEADGYNATDAKSGYAIKVADNLTIQWAVKFDSPISSGAPDWDMCSNSNWTFNSSPPGYAVGGSGTSPSNDQVCLIAKIDISGNVLWSKLYSDGNTPGSRSVVVDGAFDDSPLEIYQLTNHSSTQGLGVVTFSDATGAVNLARTSYILTPGGDYYGYEFGATCASDAILISGYGHNQSAGSVSGTFPFTVRYNKNFPAVDMFGPRFAYPLQSTNYSPGTNLLDMYETSGHPRIYYPKMFGQLWVNGITLSAFEDNAAESENYIVQPFMNGLDSCQYIDPQFFAMPMMIMEWAVNDQPATYVTPSSSYQQTPQAPVVQQCLTCPVDVGFTASQGANCTYTFTANNPGLCPFFMIFDVANTLLFTSAGSSVSYLFLVNGTYTVCYSDCAMDGFGALCRDQDCQTIQVNCPPCPLDADFSFVVSGCCVNFSDLTPEGNPDGCEYWVMGNVTTIYAGDITSFCFPGSGTYTVCHVDCCLNTDGTKSYHQVCKQVTVSCAPPCCLPTGINVSASGCCVTASAIQPGGPCGGSMFYIWSFGDGNIGTGPNVTHCYNGSGIYTVCLTAYCSKFQKVKYCKSVKVLCGIILPPPPPGGGGGGTARFSWSRSGNSIQFNSMVSSDLSASSHNWDFGDGTTSSDPNPLHLYTVSGTYLITHTVEGISGSTGEAVSQEVEQTITTVLAPACSCVPPESGAFTSSPAACQESNSIALHLIDNDSQSDIEHQWMRSTCGGAGCPVSSFVEVPGAIGQQVWVHAISETTYFRCRSLNRTLGYVTWSEEVEVQYGHFAASLAGSATSACPGESLIFNATPSGPYTYVWDPVGPDASSIAVEVSTNIGPTISVTVTSDLECGAIAEAPISVLPCQGPPNDLRSGAISLLPQTFGTCVNTAGNLSQATVSPQSNSTVITGEDLWYRFTANSVGIRVEVSTLGFDAVIELQDATGNTLAIANAVSGAGGEILNYYNSSAPLVSGQQYLIAVRNYNSSQGSGSFAICLQRIRAPQCNASPPYTSCKQFKSSWVGASSYTFTFTNTSTSGVITFTSANGITYAPLSNLVPGETYHVGIGANFTVTDGAGNPESFTVIRFNACTITMEQHPSVVMREVDRCAAGPRAQNALIAANRWICGAAYYEWRFRQMTPIQDLNFSAPLAGGPVNRFINLAPLGLIPGATYDVQIRPVFPGNVPGQWGSSQCLHIIGPAEFIAWQGDAEANEQEHTLSDQEVLIYPNPTRGDRIVLSISGIASMVHVRVMDGTGREVLRQGWYAEGPVTRELVFEQPLSPGVYLVEVLTDSARMVQRMVVQR